MRLRWPSKDENETLDYVIDWSDRLDDDTISLSAWTLPSGITQASALYDNTTTTIWLSGGTLGSTYDILNRITTAAGRTMDQTVRIKIANK